MSEPRIVLSPRPDTTPDSSRIAIARCYVYLVERQRLRKEAAEPAPPDGRDEAGWRYYTPEDIDRLRRLGVGERKKALKEARGD